MNCFLSLLLLVVLFSHGAAWAQETVPQTVRVPLAKDAVIYAEDLIDGGPRANGKGQFLTLGGFQVGLNRRLLMAFDMNGYVPPGSDVSAARLVVTPSAVTGSSALIIYRVGTRWAAGTTAPEDELYGDIAQGGDVTWDFAIYGGPVEGRGQRWQQPGGDFIRDEPLLASTGIANGKEVSYTTEQLVADVQSMLTRPDQHFGWIVLGEEGNFVTGVYQFPSSENKDEAARPYLEVTFTAPSDVEKVVANYDILDTIAGKGDKDDDANYWKPAFEGGDAKAAELSRPSTAVADGDGNVYLTDTYAHAIRRVSPDGKITTVAGTGVAGDNGDAGQALEMQLNRPNGLVVLPNGNLFILDTDNLRVCKVTPDGQLTTVFRDDTAPTLRTGIGLWVADDESRIVFASRTVIKEWRAEDNIVRIFAQGFDVLANLARDTFTNDFLVADVGDSTVWRVPNAGGSRRRVAGGGPSNAPERDAAVVRLDGVRGVAPTGHGGYFLCTQDGGDLWYVDLSGIAHILLQGAGQFDIVKGDGQVFRDLVENETGNIMSEPYSVNLAPNGDLLMMTNQAGVLRVVRKARNPRLVASGLTEQEAFSLTWTSQVQRFYIIEKSTNLLDWTVFTEAAATGNTTSISDVNLSDAQQQYYRVRLYYP